MKIRILGWEYENIRRMENVVVDLKDRDGKLFPHSLIMMPNGTGKTTTLYLIRAALSGSASRWRAWEVRAYRPMDLEVTEGKFILKIAFDEEIYYYILHLNYEEGRAWYETSNAMMLGGLEERRHIPYELRGILDNEGFVNRFVFDGEQAKKTLNTGSGEAEDAIIYLYQLNKLDDLLKTVDKIVDDVQDQNAGGSTERSVKVYKTKAEKKEQILTELKWEKKELEDQLHHLKQEQQKNKNKYEEILAQDTRLQAEQERLIKERDNNRHEMASGTMDLIGYMRKPYNLHSDLHNQLKLFVKNMQSLKLPKTTAREFFKELAESKECICGHCIGEKEKQTILRKAEEYLGQDELIAVNAIKAALNEYIREEEMDDTAEHLKELMDREHKIQSSLNRLDLKLAESGHQEILQVKKQMERVDAEIKACSERYLRLTTKDMAAITGLRPENNIYLAEKARDEARNSYLRANGTYEFTKQAESMKRYIENVKGSALKKLKSYVVEETNQKIERLVTNDKIIINKIDGHLVLDGKDGVSEGQTLAVAYAYIGTLFEHSRFEFPFVVDSPAAAMDLSVRREVAAILPKLFEQTIIFVTSGEKKGFADTFFERDDVYYLTIYGEKEDTVKYKTGQKFFEKYQEKE